ncbi:MAG TPA: metalloregulator ArsR/SmtB family transcription factor [Terriglobales bacterium]|nr:metalloregulator ArsR/SmtB family transcription factor [Terriglobales bacterium]
MTRGSKLVAREQLFRALADRTRLRLLNLMAGQELCVCYFVEVLQTSQPKVSRHLAYLRRSGLVSARREGKWMHYRLATPSDAFAARIVRETLTALADDPEMNADLRRLERACCAASPLISLGAPRPAPLSSRS